MRDDLRLAPAGDASGRAPRTTPVDEPAGDDDPGELPADEVVLLENLRFDPGEEANDPAFAGRLAELADAYVDDAFGAVHRAHASVSALPELMLASGRPAVAGRLLQREVEVLSTLCGAPPRDRTSRSWAERRSSDKLSTIDALIDRVDAMLIGGAMAFTLIAADGGGIGDSLVEPDRFDEVRAAIATRRGTRRAGRPAARCRCRPGDDGRRGVHGGRCRSDPGRLARAGHRPGDGRGVRRAPSPAPRPSCGTARWGCSSWSRSRPGRSASRRPSRRATRSRWWAAATALAAVARRRARRRVRPSLDRRRRLPGVPGGPRASRHHDPGGVPRDRTAPDHRGQLEDVQDAPGGDPGRPEALLPGGQGRRRAGRGRDLPAVHRAPLRADPDRVRPPVVRARCAERLPGGEGRVHRRDLAAHARRR